ncbi:HlyD family type I secretion periplasmic adaptor subunit [Marinomonas ostreistagni]|uniref:Membrane fusion protein (MFP) family protein n=1 Tax=Marinomonas ostreistagni TaxID=359209 RepID=A0ABS0ZCW9_9GAMM|nr:HlyD family type I secretion periplasmic adaptor subunit [Marinomonas ostreistagni]MBJ7551520.1 HlyD family type I secretion periplasmic adaptor subunit [Marinomonas ostreistagni]
MTKHDSKSGETNQAPQSAPTDKAQAKPDNATTSRTDTSKTASAKTVASSDKSTANTDKAKSSAKPAENKQALAAITPVKKPASEAKPGTPPNNTKDKPSAPQMAAPGPDVPTNDKRYIKFGLWFLLLTLGTFTAWGTLAPLSSALIAPGEVMVDSYRKTIQHFEGGIVQEIFVRNGDLVEKGEPLIQLENAQFQAQLENSFTRLQIFKAELERLTAEQSFSESVTFSDELLEAAKTDKDIANALKQQNALLSARMSAYKQESEALQTRLEQTDAQVQGINAQISGLEKQLALLAEEEEAYTTLYNEGLGDNKRARELNRSIISTQNEINSSQAEVARLKIQNTETQLQIATRKQDYLKDVGERLKQTQGNYFDILEKYQVAKDRVERSVIRAPEDGTIVDMKIHTIGSVANPGQPLLDLVPSDDNFVVESKVSPRDINDLYIGQKADIRFSAFDARTTKVIEGKVINVSADRLLEQQDQAPYYLARIQVTEHGRSNMSEDMKLKAGMPAEVMIQRGERSLFNYLFKPVEDSFARSLKEK